MTKSIIKQYIRLFIYPLSLFLTVQCHMLTNFIFLMAVCLEECSVFCCSVFASLHQALLQLGVVFPHTAVALRRKYKYKYKYITKRLL
jgi:hypothetical protein